MKPLNPPSLPVMPGLTRWAWFALIAAAYVLMRSDPARAPTTARPDGGPAEVTCVCPEPVTVSVVRQGPQVTVFGLAPDAGDCSKERAIIAGLAGALLQPEGPLGTALAADGGVRTPAEPSAQSGPSGP